MPKEEKKFSPAPKAPTYFYEKIKKLEQENATPNSKIDSLGPDLLIDDEDTLDRFRNLSVLKEGARNQDQEPINDAALWVYVTRR
jgi:hypothetical protein